MENVFTIPNRVPHRPTEVLGSQLWPAVGSVEATAPWGRRGTEHCWCNSGRCCAEKEPAQQEAGRVPQAISGPAGAEAG